MSISSRSHRLSTSYSIAPDAKGLQVWEGYMYKRGKSNRAYQKRYFVLYTNNTLAYYISKPSKSGYDKPQGEISLYNVINVKERNGNEFHLVTAKREFELKCELPEEQEEWLRRIKIRALPNVLLESWLYKKGEKGRGWRKRYCQLVEYELHYEIRYFEDRKCSKHKGTINGNLISNVRVLSQESVKKYGKERCLEIITDHRTYIVSAMDKQTRNSWYKQIKAVMYGELDKVDANSTDYEQIQQIDQNSKLFDIAEQSMANKPSPVTPVTPVTPVETGRTLKSKSIFVEHPERSPEPFIEKRSASPVSSPVMEKQSKETAAAAVVSPVNMENMIDILESTKITGIDDESSVNTATFLTGNGGTDRSTDRSDTNPFLLGDHPLSVSHSMRDNRTGYSTTSMASYTMTGSSTSMETPIPQSVKMLSNGRFVGDSTYFDMRNDNTGQNKQAVKTGSVVHSQSFLRADYEDPAYKMMGDDDESVMVKGPLNKCCVIL